MSLVRAECWAITDAAAGNQRQALALAERLELPVRHLVLAPRAPWSWFAPHLLTGADWALPPAQRTLFTPPWPRVAVGCGRAAALFTRLLGRYAAGACQTVQILDPRRDPAGWDLVVAPRHDRLAGANVLSPLGSLNPVDADWLADAREAWPHLGALPGPRIGVLLGGPRRGVRLDARYAAQLAERLRHRREGGSVLLVASRRTPPALADGLRAALADLPGLSWSGPQDGSNPYPGVLAWSDRLLVTPDSVNMLSEACAVGCPVHTLVTAPLPGRLGAFHRALREAGLLHDLDDDGAVRAQAPLRETGAIAAIVRERLGLPGARAHPSAMA